MFQTIYNLPLRLRRSILAAPIITSTILPAMPRSLRWALRRVYFSPYYLLDKFSGEQDPLIPPRSLIYDGGAEQFKRNGEIALRTQLVEVGGLKPDERVLDIGCGMGRLAVALTRYLNDAGRYDGIDIVPRGIEWCRTHITPVYPHFQFHLADIYNKEYNPKGTHRACDYSFPLPDATFDFVFLISVFTHMLPEDLEHYIAEIARLMKPGGRCLATFFLLNEDSRRLMAEGKSVINFAYNFGVYSTVNKSVPELSIAYEEPFILELGARYGLTLFQPIYYAGWDGCNGSPHLGKQDIIVLGKPPASNP